MNRTTCSILQSFLLVLEFVEFITSPQGILASLGILIYVYFVTGIS
jgi:hypothetical protein